MSIEQGFTRGQFLRRTATVAAGTGLLGLVGPQVATAFAAAAVDDLGMPYSSYSVLDTAFGRGADGRQLLYGCTYVVSDAGVTFFAVDPMTGDVVTQRHIAGNWGPYHVAAAPDGKVYVGCNTLAGPARMWMYDPDTDEIQVVATVAGEAIFYGIAVGAWSTTGASDHTIYVGAYPSGAVYEYDPVRRTFTSLGSVVAGHTYAKALLALEDRRLLVGTGSPAGLTLLNVATGERRDVLPDAYRGYSFAYNIDRVRDDVFVKVVVPDSRVLRFDATDLRFRGESPADPGSWGPPVFPTEHARPGEVYLLGTDGDGVTGIFRNDLRTAAATLVTEESSWAGAHVWWTKPHAQGWATSIGSSGDWGRWRPRTGELVTRRLPLPGAPKEITALHRGPDGRVYGDTYESQVLYALDPETDKVEILGPIGKNRSGEVLAFATTGGRLFMAAYTSAVITVYDPARPWAPGTGDDANPRDLGSIGEEQYRPEDAVVGSDDRVWVASWAAYGQLGGALTAIAPDTYAMQSWRFVADDHNLHAVEAGNGELYVGTSRFGDGVTAAGAARLVVFDIASESTAFETEPVAGAGIVMALAGAPDGRIYGTTDTGQWFTFDPASRTVTPLGGFPYGPANGLVTGPDGLLYGTTAGVAFRIDPATNAVTKLGDGGSRFGRALAFDGDGRFYWGAGARLMRLTP